MDEMERQLELEWTYCVFFSLKGDISWKTDNQSCIKLDLEYHLPSGLLKVPSIQVKKQNTDVF